MLAKNTKIELLKRVPLFSGCSKPELGALAKVADGPPGDWFGEITLLTRAPARRP